MMLPHGASWARPEGLRALLACAVMGEQFHHKFLEWESFLEAGAVRKEPPECPELAVTALWETGTG